MQTMNRRELLGALWGKRARGKSLPAPDPVVLLLGRTSFGVTEGDLARARSLGYSAALEEQLAPQGIQEAALDQALNSLLPTLNLDVPALLAYGQNDGQMFRPLSELLTATLARQLYSRKQLFEVMVEFWSNHFSVFHPDGPIRYFKTYEDRTVIRAHALGRFRDLLKGSARSAAMQYYLDNYTNVVGGPNENYARELMELHTLGVDGGYTEADVKEVSRAFTGWTISGRNVDGFQFVPLRHDLGQKQVLGTTLPGGRGMEDGDDVLDLLASHPSTARFIATKLVRRFVDDEPPESLVTQVAGVFASTDGDIKAMLRTIFQSAEFAASGDSKFKRPAELVMSTLRNTGARAIGDYIRPLINQLESLGQLPFQWSPPDGYPDFREYWLNTSALLTRWNFGFALAEGKLAPRVAIDESALGYGARSATELVDRLADRVLHRVLAPEDRSALIAYAANGAAPGAELSKLERERATVAVLGVLLASDYFQYH